MTIESVTKGSTILILRGADKAIKRLQRFLSQENPRLGGIPVAAVEFIAFESPPSHPEISRKARSPRPEYSPLPRSGAMSLVLEDFNLNAAERLLCEQALHTAGSIVEAAQLLGITRHALKRRIIKHQISWQHHDGLSDHSTRSVARRTAS